MGMSALVLDPQQADFMAACERANRWIDTARPIIKAMYAVVDADAPHILPAKIAARGDRRWNEPRTTGERTYDEAAKHLATAHSGLFEMLDGIRADFLADEMPPQPEPGASDQEWTDRDEFSDALDEAVTSVADAIKQIGNEI